MARNVGNTSPPKKPPLTEIFAWNENIFGLVALGWGLIFLLSDFESSSFSVRGWISMIIMGGGIALMLMQYEWIRTFLDFQFPVIVLKRLPIIVHPAILKMWPISILIRGFNHFFFTVWWLLLGTIVSLRFDSLEDIRLILYFGFASLHFDRFIRLIQWIRR